MSNREEDLRKRGRGTNPGTPAWKSQNAGPRSIHNSSRRPSGYTERYQMDPVDDDELLFDADGGQGIKKNRNFAKPDTEQETPAIPAWKRQNTEQHTGSTERHRVTRAARPVEEDVQPVRRASRPVEEDVQLVRRPSRDADETRRRTTNTRDTGRGSEEVRAERSSKVKSSGTHHRGSKKRSMKRKLRKMIRRTPIIRYAAVAAAAILILFGGFFAVRGLIHAIGGGSNIIARALPSEAEWNKKLFIASADRKAAMYDYDAAIDMLKEYDGYETDEEISAAISEYEATKATLVEYPVEEITHVFFHMLLFEPEVAFGETCDNPTGMNQYMTTVSEFNKIIQSMYDKGYVLVSLYDVAAPGPDGNFQPGKIMLPPGKKAFVLSEDDVCCYHAYENAGIADKFVLDEATGKVKTHYTYLDGREEVGDFDVMPIIDTFVEEHPDFSYKGAKGVLAFTGYNGILGYRTDTTYDDKSPDVADRDRHEQAWLDAHPDFNYDQEIEDCKKVCQAARDNGWLLASHSWGHLWQEKMGDYDFDEDTKKWMDRVYPLLGECDIWIYPNGQDVDNSYYQHRFETLQSYGFKYFCPVNSLQYSTRIDSYGLNQGRRNLDGYRMYYDMIDPEHDWLSDLFDVEEVFDPARPTPVPEI